MGITVVNYSYPLNNYSTGTLRKNRKGIPEEIKDITGREPFSTQVWYEKEAQYISITSYTPTTKSKGPKNVLFLSTGKHILGTEKEGTRKKPGVGKFYDLNKG